MTMEEFWRRLLEELSRDGLVRQELAGAELEQVNALADEKYRSWEWTYGRSPAIRLHEQGPLSGRHAFGAAGGERRRDTLRPLSGTLWL
jgi:lipoate-protein ligase A